MQPDCGGQDHSFQITTLADQIIDRVPMIDGKRGLGDDGAFVQFLCDVVAGRADYLNPALVRLVVRPGPGECGKKTVVNVDDAFLVIRHELRGEDLHVACEHDDVDAILSQQGSKALLMDFRPGGGRRQVVERNATGGDVVGQVLVIAGYERDIHGKLAGLPPPKQITEAVALFGDQNGHPLGLVAPEDSPAHCEPIGHCRPCLAERVRAEREVCQLHLQAHEELAMLRIGMLIGLEDIAVVGRNETSYGRDDSPLVGTRYEQPSRFPCHVLVTLARKPYVVRNML